MPPETCQDHGNICGKIGSMEAKIDAMKDSIDRAVKGIEHHIEEADKPGGVRERVLILEATIRVQQESISTIKQSYWKVGLAYAVVGGLIARLAPEYIWELIVKIFHAVTK